MLNRHVKLNSFVSIKKASDFSTIFYFRITVVTLIVTWIP